MTGMVVVANFALYYELAKCSGGVDVWLIASGSGIYMDTRKAALAELDATGLAKTRRGRWSKDSRWR